MASLSRISDQITQRLELRYEPVGVQLFGENDPLPPGIDTSERKVKSYCQALMLAGEGEDLYLTKDRLGCKLGTSALGMESDPAPFLDDGVLEKYGVGLFATEEASAKTILNAELLQQGSTRAVRIAPLSEFPDPPHVVVFIANPEQIMWLLYAFNYDTGGPMTLPQSGGALGGCSDITVYPLLRKQTNVTFLGLGCRLKSQIQPEHLMMGIPGSAIQAVYEHLLAMEKPVNMLKQASAPG